LRISEGPFVEVVLRVLDGVAGACVVAAVDVATPGELAAEIELAGAVVLLDVVVTPADGVEVAVGVAGASEAAAFVVSARVVSAGD
jgi:hypothetical protein